MTIMTIMTIATRMSMATMRKLEVVHKKVGGCLISFNLQLASVRKFEAIWPDARTLPGQSLWMMNHEWMTQWVPCVGIELLWQLKTWKYPIEYFYTPDPNPLASWPFSNGWTEPDIENTTRLALNEKFTSDNWWWFAFGDVFDWTTNGSLVIVGDFNGGTILQREFLYVRITRKRGARAEVI